MTAQDHPNDNEFRPIREVMSASEQLDQHLTSAISEFSPPQPEKPAMTTSFAASLKAMMDEARAGVTQARADGLATVQDAVSELNKAKVATEHVTGMMAKTIKDEAASVLAELGQISNDLGV